MSSLKNKLIDTLLGLAARISLGKELASAEAELGVLMGQSQDLALEIRAQQERVNKLTKQFDATTTFETSSLAPLSKDHFAYQVYVDPVSNEPFDVWIDGLAFE